MAGRLPKLASWRASRPPGSLPESPDDVVYTLLDNPQTVYAWALQVRATRTCQQCGMGMVDFALFAERIGQYFQLTEDRRDQLLRDLVLTLAATGIEGGLLGSPRVCSACTDPG